MDFAKLRNDFKVYVVDSERVYIETIGKALTTAGYEVELFQKGEDLLGALKISPPHIVITGTYLMGFTGLQVVKEIKNLSPDIHVIYMANYAESELARQALEAGAYEILLKPIPDIQTAIHAVDRLAQRIYLESANEELYDKLLASRAHQKRLRQRLKMERRILNKPTHLTGLLQSVRDTSEAVQVFLEHASTALDDVPILFFRYLESQSSFVLSHAVHVPVQRYRGVSLNLSADALKADDSDLRDLVATVFESEGYHGNFLHNDGQTMGLFVFLKPMSDPLIRQTMFHMLQIFELAYSRLLLQVRLFDQTIKDSTNYFYLKTHFFGRCEQEISRSRRIKKPVSLLHIVIDKWEELSQAEKIEVNAQLATLIQQTCRITDIAGFLSDTELGILLPHTDSIGAAIKAEKLRRLVERTTFCDGNRSITLSMGVSEYPNLCVDAESLRQAADAACFQIKRVGNKVCLAAAPTGLQPDFTFERLIG